MIIRSRPVVRVLSVVTLASLLGACGASLRPPQLQVQKLDLGKATLAGLNAEVFFTVRNPNEQPLSVDHFEYDLFVNGNRLGRGDVDQRLELQPFESQPVVSRFQLSWLSLPGSVKSVLDRDRAEAEVKGTFYVRSGGGYKKLGFESRGQVDLRR